MDLKKKEFPLTARLASVKRFQSNHTVWVDGPVDLGEMRRKGSE
jgi:hypothetical protein